LGSLVEVVNVIHMSLLHCIILHYITDLIMMGILCTGQSCRNFECNLHVSDSLCYIIFTVYILYFHVSR